MKKEIRAKAISFNAIFKGYGCVNFDSNEQSFYLRSNNLVRGKVYDNVSYAKKNFYINESEKTGFKYKVSSECIRNSMYEDEMGLQVNENVMQIPTVLYNALATPAVIERGYLMATSKYVIKEKSPLTITDAIENINCLRYDTNFDFHSKSVKKEQASGDKGSTSIYSIENVGECEYVSHGYIDMEEMQFISFDDTYDRCAVNVDVESNKAMYMDALKRNIPNFSCKEGYFYIKSHYTKDEWAEKGILLSEDIVDFLTKDILKRLLKLNIRRRNALFGIKSLTISYVGADGCEGIEENQEITLDNIDDFKFLPYVKYMEADDDLILKNKEKYEEILQRESKTNSKNK